MTLQQSDKPREQDTPRTDEQVNILIPRVTNIGCVPADFARQLERELAFWMPKERPEYGAPGSRDVDIGKAQRKWDEFQALASSAREQTPHWVFAAAERHRPIVEGLIGCEIDRRHMIHMLDQIKGGGFSATKACRWLGWIQGVLNEKHALTLDEAKAINKAASVATDDRAEGAGRG